jgi:arginine utilization regulatory protein
VVNPVLESGSYEEAMTSFRRRFLEEALVRHGGNRSATARELGISRQTLLYHIRALGLTV